MPPFPHVHRYNDFGLEAVREHSPRPLRRFSYIQQIKIRFFCSRTSSYPYIVRRRILHEKARLDKRNLRTEPVLAIVAISGRFLRIARNAMSDNLMRYATVNRKSNCHRRMFKHRFMPSRYEVLHKPCRAVGSNCPFGLVASAPCRFNRGINRCPRCVIQSLRAKDFITRLDNLQRTSPLFSYSWIVPSENRT